MITHTAHERDQDGPTAIAPAAQIVKELRLHREAAARLPRVCHYSRR